MANEEPSRPPPAPVHPHLRAPPPVPPDLPSLEPVDWATIERDGSRPVDAGQTDSSAPLPEVDAVVITWTEAEWAALDHVFCHSGDALSYEAAVDPEAGWREGWERYGRGWELIASSLPDGSERRAPSLEHRAWGSWRRVEFPDTGRTALLFKSDMHIASDGVTIPLRDLVQRLVAECRPELFVTTGTAGGTRLADPIGTVVITASARFRLTEAFEDLVYNWERFTSERPPDPGRIEEIGALLRPPPVRREDLELLASSDELDGYDLEALENAAVRPGNLAPHARVTDRPCLTDNAYAAATTIGAYDGFACLEMDDAVIAMGCASAGVPFAIVRNISDPVLNPGVPAHVNQSWSYLLYHTYGLYTSFNGALCSWGLVSK